MAPAMMNEAPEWMAQAVELGRNGDPSPNPHVGCVVVRDSAVVGSGFHVAAGQAHAEIAALNMAGEQARGATLYVTLEPCNHQGRTPPCTDAILKAGITRVVIGSLDPNPHVAGGGAERLRSVGIEVVTGVLSHACDTLIRPWRTYVTDGLAHLALKLAVSLDGRTAAKTGASKWITCSEARTHGHRLRAASDAVMIGVSTVVADDPLLTVRRNVRGRNPVRVVVDSRLRMPVDCQLVKTASEIPTCVVTTPGSSVKTEEALAERRVTVIRVKANAQGRCDMRAVLRALAQREVVSVLCEGGAELAGSLLADQLVQEMHLFISPILLGPRGRPCAVDWAGPDEPALAPRIEPASWDQFGSAGYLSGPLKYPARSASVPPEDP
jgi:diaminohydroxyphosphoribosylaminopyrimidine deaminase / 5-amino-6-(5-phosphoribosylamino)uracil reductase